MLDYEQCPLSTSAALECTTPEPAGGVSKTVSASILKRKGGGGGNGWKSSAERWPYGKREGARGLCVLLPLIQT